MSSFYFNTDLFFYNPKLDKNIFINPLKIDL